MLELVLLPSGHPAFSETGDTANNENAPEISAILLQKAFEKGYSEGILHLATRGYGTSLPAVLSFWRHFGERYLTELCHTPESSENMSAPLPTPHEDLAEIAASAPPMRGGEYLNTDMLAKLWADLDAYAREEIAQCKGGLSEWLMARSPLWHRVGRVCFHLAENKGDTECPFAFLATYAPRLLDSRRVQYQPLGNALEEYTGEKDKNKLINLLTPVRRAAEHCAWVKDMVDSGEIFHPIRWTPGEAYRFLKNAQLLKENGILVRMPDWWTKRPPRVQAGVSIGNSTQSRLDAGSILDFNVELVLEGETLTKEELNNLLAGNDGLVFLKGRWVEVNKEKLQAALAHWKHVENAAGKNGISFIEGMRLLSGVPMNSDSADTSDADNTDWCNVHAGEWLESQLREIRDPESLATALPENELRATLRPYQKTGVKWLRFLSKLGLGACLADDMGLGKTIQVIALLLMIKREKKNDTSAPALIVLPASLLANWKTEMERFAPALSFRFAHPSLTSSEELRKASKNPRNFTENIDAVFTTYSMLARMEWLSSIKWSLAVLDEAQAIKNPSARQTRMVKKINALSRIVLTGTPVENRLSDLWSIFDFLCPGLLGSSKAFSGFIKRLEKREHSQYAPLRRLVSPFILRRLKTDKSVIADLPDKTEVRAFCRLSKKQVMMYEQAVREMIYALKNADGIKRRGLILSFILRFKQICNHPAQWLASGDYAPEKSGKFGRLAQICEELAERQEKTLIFTQFREMTEPLSEFLKTVFRRPGLVLHGQVAVKKRKALIDDFQREDGPPFFVLSLKAGGTGLNLTSASHVIHFDRWWNPAVENQATDRAFRIGQRKNVMVHKFICQGTIEEKIDALINDKKTLAEEVVEDGTPKLITEMGDKELLNLVRLDISTIEED